MASSPCRAEKHAARSFFAPRTGAHNDQDCDTVIDRTLIRYYRKNQRRN